MCYINRIRRKTKNIVLTNFNIVNSDKKTSILYFNIFNDPDNAANPISYGNGIGEWSTYQKYNVYYSYDICSGGYGYVAKSPVYYNKYVPYIKTSSTPIQIKSVEIEDVIQKFYKVNTYYLNSIDTINGIATYLDNRYIPENISGVFCGKDYVSESDYKTISTSIATNGYYEDDQAGIDIHLLK